MPVRALILVVHVIIVSSGTASQCPAISDWRNAPITAGGPLICAKIYEDRNCSRRPLQVGLNESLPDLQVPFSIMLFENFQLTALVRPGCTLRLWSGLSYTAEERSSTDYVWHTDSNDTMSASCECIMYDPEFLACEPRKQTVTIQECTFFNSSFGGICPYSPLLRPFKSEDADLNQRSCTNRSTLTEQEEDALNATLKSYKRSSFKSPFGQDQETFFAHVLPQQGLRVVQRMLRCDKYVLPTPEVRLEYDYAVRDTWTLSAQEDKLYYAVCQYFMRVYVGSYDDEANQFHLSELSAWHEGVYEGGSTNNGLERRNLAYKERETIRKRLSLREFLHKAETAIHRWSINPDYQFSSVNATVEEAARNCTHLGGVIALRGRAEQNEPLKKIIAHSFAAYNATFWTAAVGIRPQSFGRCVLSWLGGAATDHAGFFWPFDALSSAAQPKAGHEAFVDCKLALPYICEKKPLVY